MERACDSKKREVLRSFAVLRSFNQRNYKYGVVRFIRLKKNFRRDQDNPKGVLRCILGLSGFQEVFK